MVPYDKRFRPPAPIVEVVIAQAGIGASVTLAGKLDTGADVTAIPVSVVAELGLPPRSRAWTRGFDGRYSQRMVYYPRLALAGTELPAVRCVAAERDDVLLGRNVLNRFTILLDGPNQQLEFLDG